MASQGKKLINDPNAVVTEFIEGLVETYPGLQYLDGFPEIKVVLRADYASTMLDKVAVISGGGSGHEPAHAGFVGEGMLSAAICGEVFTSPQVDAILSGIRAVTGPMGCLLIVTNYTGDRLNFGLAAELAKSEGYKVETVIVGDDCALPPQRGIVGRRGLAGTFLVNKIAGAAAATGLSLDEVAAEAKRASEMVGTMGVALSVCTLPGQVTSDRLGPGKMELGLGIHGEPGAAVADLQPVEVVVSHVLQEILSPDRNYVPITPGNRVVLLVNGLGATPAMELMIVAGKAVPQLQLEHGLAVDRVYTGSFMTSLDMAGFSISIMKADEAILQRLDASTKAPYWPVGVDGLCLSSFPTTNQTHRNKTMKQGLLLWSPCPHSLLSPPSFPFLSFSIQRTKHTLSPIAATLDSTTTHQEQQLLTARERRQLRNEKRESKAGYNWREELEDRFIKKPKKKPTTSMAEELNLDKLALLGPQWWIVRVSRIRGDETADVLARLLARNFPQMDFKVYAPSVKERRKLKNGTYSVKPKPIFPGCVFLWCVLNKEIHDFVRECDGVGGFVGAKVGNTKRQINKPRPVSDDDMEAVFQQAKEEQEKADIGFEEEQQAQGALNSVKLGSNNIAQSFIDSNSERGLRKISGPLVSSSSRKKGDLPKTGSTVRVVSGTFADFVGSLKKLNRKTGKATVVVTLFGKESLVELDLSEIVAEMK